MGKGFSRGVLAAKEYNAKHPGQLTAVQLAEKFWIDPSTIYRADWWRHRNDPTWVEPVKEQPKIRKRPKAPGDVTTTEAIVMLKAGEVEQVK